MNWVDVLVVVLALLAAVSGARQGVLVALPAFLGVVAGALLGIELAPMLVDSFDEPAARVAIAVGTVVFLVALGETLGVLAGSQLKNRVRSPKLSSVDSTLGAIVQGVVVFVVAWLIALPLTSVAAMPGLARAINDSSVLGGVNNLMPDAAQGLPGELRQLLDASGFPSIVDPFQQAPVREISPPDENLPASQVVREAQPSVLKIRGVASTCARSLEGSGFVVAPDRVMTNAHVVAGTDQVAVETPQGRIDSTVVHYDPGTDLAVLSVPGLEAPTMDLREQSAVEGDDAIALGYPLDGPYTASSLRIRQRINLQGPDIYDANTVVRDVFTVRGQVRSGNSGGPMIDREGNVIGVVFGASVEDPDTGFILTADEVREEYERAPAYSGEVSTGPCTS
ncbi:acid resistance periplasmic serine protease MarP [Saccharomonospora sp. CUA-673]|uniref:MarP family serine protease n=1 Tax=Saccharomonospora sp. CUA-673 TaxID=1904969 RepID=UPI000968C2DB|nr:MarP family serine protease [Saccharomonospora sp. CUA-673]OLT48443.1 acid resistance periplasmic serine protease MarP [Saccharomonospora sp. CUA-673]